MKTRILVQLNDTGTAVTKSAADDAAAYYMTGDFAGDDPMVHNNRLLYLFGFDRDLLVHNLSIDIKVQGEIKLNSDNIDASDIEYGPDEKLTVELNGAWSIEDGDFMIMPELQFSLVEDTWLNMKYTFFYGDSDTFFGQFEDNDFLEIRLVYSF